MARFSGVVAYGVPVETSPGVFLDGIVERTYFGDTVKEARNALEGFSVNDDISLTSSVSIVADAYALGHFHQIRYVKLYGVAWRVTNVEVKHPRLILRLGAKHNGVTA